jgi:hypothetical protein
MHVDSEIGILKSLWSRDGNGQWGVSDLKSLTLKPRPGFDADFFAFESDMALMTARPSGNIHDVFASFGPTDFLMKQSIMPVIAWTTGATSIRCIGTAFVVSCTGYIVTACHVLLDPQESGYGNVKVDGINLVFGDGISMGVLMPLSPAYGTKAVRFLPLQQAWYWGNWRDSPLLHEDKRFDSLVDVAVCKIPDHPEGSAYQPLNLSLNPFSTGEIAYAIGYAMMDDIQVGYVDGQMRIPEFDWDLYVSIGEVAEVFPQNHLTRDIPTPGPSFDFRARIPGKMSGAPIFGDRGSIVRGVVSRSFSGEKHAYGCMIGPTMNLPLSNESSLKKLMEGGNEGIAVVRGPGL